MVCIIKNISEISYYIFRGIGFIIKNISEIFYYIFGGIGLFFGGIGGLIAFYNWVSERRKRNIIKKKALDLRTKYPLENLNETFKLIKVHKEKKVFLFDMDANEKYWIETMCTLRELGFDFSMVNKYEKKEVDSIKEGKSIYICD